MARFVVRALLVGMIFLCWTATVAAQEMPANIGIDSSFRVGFLFGRNTILYKDALAVRSIPDTCNATFGYWRM